MALRNKIDSNETGLAIAAEVVGQPGTLPGSPVWYDLEPNEYDDFGGEPTLLARRPINSSRQRKKGAIVDLAAQGGFNQDFTNDNSKLLLSGFMYANYRKKLNEEPDEVTATGYVVADEAIYTVGMLLYASGFANSANNGLKVVTSVDSGSSEVRCSGLAAEAVPPDGAKIQVVGFQGNTGDVDVSVSGDFATITVANFDVEDLGIIPGEFIFVGGDSAGLRFGTAANNGIKRVRSVSSTAIVVDKSDLAMVNEANTTGTIQIFVGDVLKNELADNIVRQSFQLERTLGVPDPANPSQVQSEYIIGAFPNEMELVVESADKINANYSFVAITNELRTATTGPKNGDRVGVVESDAYNTSSDFARIRLSTVSSSNEAPSPLFAFITDFTLTINNNVSLNKAVGYLGGFDATIGLFEVGLEINAYFTTVESVEAVKNSTDVTFDFFVAKQNRGFAVDLPLLALGGGMPEIEIDEPIMIPLEGEAATAAKISSDFNHTLMWTIFDYLPTAAG
jgi:hypothetical protein